MLDSVFNKIFNALDFFIYIRYYKYTNNAKYGGF